MRGKILVIRGGAIGDFILTLPAVAALRAHFPEAHLEVLGYPHIAQLALAAGLADKVQAIEARGLAGFFARNGELSEDLADYFSEFDLIVSFLYDPDNIFRTNIARCSTGQFIAAPHRAAEDELVHASRVYLRPLERLAIFDADPIPRISIGRPGPLLRQLALHPGSGSEQKNWPEEKWQALLAYFGNSTDYQLLLIGGEAEGERLQRLIASLKFPLERLRLAQNLPLAELAALMQASSFFIGHDSGISHLASALGLPGLILWGPTTETIWRPPGEKIRILRHSHSLSDLSVQTVIENFHLLETQNRILTKD